MQKELLAKIENHNRKIKEVFSIENNVITKVEDKWSTGDFVGTGAELIDFVSDSDDEQRINYVRSIVDNHLNFFKLKGN